MNLRKDLFSLVLDELRINHSSDKILKIALVGGGASEPEITFLKNEFVLQVDFFGIEDIPGNVVNFIDLNQKANLKDSQIASYDLVLCSQVLEHLWNIPNAFETLSLLVKKGGSVWVACPYSNYFHGSPYVFSTGYSPEFLVEIGKHANLVVKDCGYVSSPREYLARHVLHVWASSIQLRFPLFAYFGKEGHFVNKFLYNLSILPERILLQLKTKKIGTNVFYATESWGLFTK
jgi:SAM-dependent methyltransferase